MYAADGQTGNEESNVRDGHVLAQSTHGRHLVAVYGMDDAAGPEEEQRLEHGVGEEVEHGGHVTQRTHVFVAGGVFGADTERYHHERNLRDGGEGQHALDVALAAGHGGSVEGGEGSHPGHYVKGSGSILNPQGEETGNLEHTGHYHGGGMDEGRHGGRAFHGIGQPDVEGEHGTLTGTADEHEEQGGGQHHGSLGKAFLAELKAEGAAVVTIDEDTDKEEHIGKAGYDECLLRSGDGCGGGVVETDEQVGGNAHQLPEHVHLEDVGGHHQSEHGHGEEAQESVITLEAAFAVHIAERVDMHHERHRGDDDEHHHGDGVKHDTHVEAQPFHKEGKPLEVVGHQRGQHSFGRPGGLEEVGVCRGVRQGRNCQQYCRSHQAGGFVAEPFPEHSQEDEREEWQQKN